VQRAGRTRFDRGQPPGGTISITTPSSVIPVTAQPPLSDTRTAVPSSIGGWDGSASGRAPGSGQPPGRPPGASLRASGHGSEGSARVI